MKNYKTLIIDNYDSFTYNLYQYIGELNANPIVCKNDELEIKYLEKIKPSHIIISPGPGKPSKKNDFGICKNIIKQYYKSIPILGVCLGHQGIAEYFGAKIVNAPKVMHGKKSIIIHNSDSLFSDIPENFEAMRYHSLLISDKNFPSSLEIIAKTVEDNLIMALKHKNYPVYGVQFHPESIGTGFGIKILKNFLT